MAGEQLLVTEGRESGTRLSVDGDLLIGRVAPKEEGRLGEDPELSRRHAWISREPDGQLTIDDLGSANGTFVNGERIDAPRTLDPGDVVKLGRTVLEVTGPSGAVAAKTRVPAARCRGASPGGRRAGRGAGGHRRDGAGPPVHPGRGAGHRPDGQRRGGAERRRRALTPPRPRLPRRRRRAEHRGSRVGERDIRERRARERPPVAEGGRLGARRLDDPGVD